MSFLGLGRTEVHSLEDLFIWELQDLYDAENQLIDALPLMVEAAHSSQLKQAFQRHLQQTKQQCSRLEDVFRQSGKEPERITCDGMRGLLDEGQEAIDLRGDADVIDAALIAAAQKVEHYEIACYGTLRTFAEHLGNSEVVILLEQTLEEEKQTDKMLTQIAEENVNLRAQHV
jgi:ferritin-like metal-binding protein YciE